ncbi:Uma2 family endonuclease [Streptomyces sp. NPDC056529]|uniref:Uma2 family endonuclease n=1 Tax=Streptomyces sp. NPDC056529 TaxID=3345855 RepID=UPI0036C750CA
MSTAADYSNVDPERALKYAVQHIRGDRAQIIEGIIEPGSPTWDHEAAAETIRDQIRLRARQLGCLTGSGNLDLPGSSNWFVPDIAVVPAAQAKGAAALLPEDTLLIVEVTSESNGDTDRVVKRRRYAEYNAPLYLVIDRQERSVTLFSEPGKLGYTRVDGPHPFGTPITLPEPFGLDLDTTELN